MRKAPKRGQVQKRVWEAEPASNSNPTIRGADVTIGPRGRQVSFVGGRVKAPNETDLPCLIIRSICGTPIGLIRF